MITAHIAVPIITPFTIPRAASILPLDYIFELTKEHNQGTTVLGYEIRMPDNRVIRPVPLNMHSIRMIVKRVVVLVNRANIDFDFGLRTFH